MLIFFTVNLFFIVSGQSLFRQEDRLLAKTPNLISTWAYRLSFLQYFKRQFIKKSFDREIRTSQDRRDFFLIVQIANDLSDWDRAS
jgi:hypothetical protein